MILLGHYTFYLPNFMNSNEALLYFLSRYWTFAS